MVKIRDVAEMAGVSISTVSYVINGKAEQMRIAEATQKKIWEAVNKLNYQPNMQAKRLKTGKGFIPSYVVLWNARIHADLLERFMRGVHILREEDKLPFEIIIYPYQEDTLTDACHYLKKVSCNGAVFIGFSENDVKLAEQQTFNIPIVMFGNSNKFNSVVVDDLEVGRVAAEHMNACGCKEITVIPYVRNIGKVEERIASFQQRCKELGVVIHIQEKEYEYSMEGGMLAASEALQQFPDLNGLYFTVDIMAAGGVNWLSYNRTRIGRRIQVMSHGNTIFSRCTYPQITVTNLPIEEMAAESIRILSGKNNSNMAELSCITVPFTLIERESCSKTI